MEIELHFPKDPKKKKDLEHQLAIILAQAIESVLETKYTAKQSVEVIAKLLEKHSSCD